jgi:hypothetical protein
MLRGIIGIACNCNALTRGRERQGENRPASTPIPAEWKANLAVETQFAHQPDETPVPTIAEKNLRGARQLRVSMSVIFRDFMGAPAFFSSRRLASFARFIGVDAAVARVRTRHRCYRQLETGQLSVGGRINAALIRSS